MKFNVKKPETTAQEEFYTDADMTASADDDAAMSDIDFGFEDQMPSDDGQEDAIMFGHELDDDDADDVEADDAETADDDATDAADATDATDETDAIADVDDTEAPAETETAETVTPAPVKAVKTKAVKTKTAKTKTKAVKAKADAVYTVASYSTDDDDIDIATYASQEEAVKAVIKDFTKELSKPEVFMNLDGDVVFNTEKTVIKTASGKKIWKIKA